jgi:hypothetical protein
MKDVIATPTVIGKDLIFEGELEATTRSLEKLAKDHHRYNLEIEAKKNLPVVSVGMPQWWDLTQLEHDGKQVLSSEISLLVRDAKIYLLQVACSFRPAPKSQIEWSRFNLYLRTKAGKEPVIALDLYPREIINHKMGEVNLSFSPSLKFQEVEGKVGEISSKIEYKSIEPIVIGYGALESTPNWDYYKHKDFPIQGTRFSYLLIKRPIKAEGVRLSLNLTAEVSIPGGVFSAKIKGSDSGHLSKLVCSD